MCVRLIPAHAGKTFAQRDQPSPGPAHPRSRGENPSLPPLFRLIPAHAGKTCGGRTRRRQAAAHPRSRGENMTIATDLKVSLGSSPLTRGKLRHQQIAAPGGRLIPAHAGKTPAARQSRAETAAHPRSRGENLWETLPNGGRRGSSPLTRGKRADDALRLSNPGLIPAHAGKTLRSGSLIGRTTAHPRSRGENHWMPHPIDPSRGSSPLTRGKHFPFTLDDGTRRLIPAHAGKTAPLNLPWGPTGAHPRSRGENTPDV